MSYLNPVRLHFAGRFRADVSTVNNDIQHFDNQTFSANFQLPQRPGSPNGWWQPAGTGAWRLIDCAVTAACRRDGTTAVAPAEDAAVGVAVRESGDRASAKLVDLDPDQQGVSMIFGLTVRLVDDNGQLLVKGDFEPAPFFDLQFNRSEESGDSAACAYFQSVLTNIEWGNVTASTCLTQMQQACAGALSIKFMTDIYTMGGQQRGYGRIVGTIGPYLDGEPRSFVMGRHLAPSVSSSPYAPVDCRLDRERRKIFVDVGNALQMNMATGDFADVGTLALAAGTGAAATPLGILDYSGPKNYLKTAGVYELPAGRTLTDAELLAATQQPLQLTAQATGAAAPTTIASESDDGVYMRVEPFVFRLDPGASETADLIVSRFGEPFDGATPGAQAQPFSLPATSPLPQVTTDPKTDANGRAKLTITAVDAKNPRGFIDGQVYGIAFGVQESPVSPSGFDPSNFISLLMFNALLPPPTPQWDDVHPIFEQYAHLYPRPHGPNPYAPFGGLPPSHPVVNLDDYASVAGFAEHIIWALSLPISHPSHMPVTRDLSGAKRALLLKWLRDVGADGLPRRSGTVAMAAAAARVAPENYSTTAFPTKRALIRHTPPDNA